MTSGAQQVIYFLQNWDLTSVLQYILGLYLDQLTLFYHHVRHFIRALGRLVAMKRKTWWGRSSYEF